MALPRQLFWDVVVHPDYRGTGLGRVGRNCPSHPHPGRVYLMTTHQQRFYEQIGFECNSSTTMKGYNRR